MTKERTQQEQERRLKDICRRIMSEDHPGRLNAMLEPEIYGCDVQKGTSQIRFENKEWEKNQRGELHGGAIASMMDTAMGMTVAAFSEDREVSTAELNVSFIRPFLGNAYLIESEILHSGRTLIRVRAKAYDQDSGKCLASATGNFIYIG